MARVTVRKELWIAVFALAGLAALFAPPVAAGERITADVPESFEINGQLYPAGELTVREVATYSPVATLNEICVEGTCELMLARDASHGEFARENELTFTRATDGHLILVGISLRGEPARELYEYRTANGGWMLPSNDATTPRPLVVASIP